MMMTSIILLACRCKGSNMRITKEKKQENHDRIVTIASEMFRERGFDGVGVADLMKVAGLTHGGFYNHFASKEALIGEAATKGFVETSDRYASYSVSDVIDAYISRQHRDARGQGCPAAARAVRRRDCRRKLGPSSAKASRACLRHWSEASLGNLMPVHRRSAF